MFNIVTGGAGFVGSHLVNALVDDGEDVLIVDNLRSGHVRNVEYALSSGRAAFAYLDVASGSAQLEELLAQRKIRKVDRIYHFASLTSPRSYREDGWNALLANSLGCVSMIELALHVGARFLLASSAEVYGDALLHPQPEEYYGNVDPVGPRSAYGEGKRFAEAAVAAAVRSRDLDARIVRFFNCYGPGMTDNDGRLIPALIDALRTGKPFPIHGSGKQTRSLVYVRDAVRLTRLVMDHARASYDPVNVGGDQERSVEKIAQALALVANVRYSASYLPSREQDPQQRRPDLTRAERFGWSPQTTLEDGLLETYRWFTEDRLAFA